MKKIIGIIFVSLMFANIGFAEIRKIEGWSTETGGFETTCVDGYKFVTVKDWIDKDMGLSITQAFEERDGKSLPAKC